jgi:hypothetical protein
MGPHEQSIAKRAYQNGEPMPERIANAPELKLGLQLYLNAFLDLDSERELGPIPWSSISNYARTFGFDEEQTADLFYFVRKTDNAVTRKRSEKQKADAKIRTY